MRDPDGEHSRFPLCLLVAPAQVFYLMTKAKIYLKYLKRGPGIYRKLDFVVMPPSEWGAGILDGIRLGFEQLIDCKGLHPAMPIEGIGIEAFNAMLEVLRFYPISQKVHFFDFERGYALDEMIFEHRGTGGRITLYNRVKLFGHSG